MRVYTIGWMTILASTFAFDASAMRTPCKFDPACACYSGLADPTFIRDETIRVSYNQSTSKAKYVIQAGRDQSGVTVQGSDDMSGKVEDDATTIVDATGSLKTTAGKNGAGCDYNSKVTSDKYALSLMDRALDTLVAQDSYTKNDRKNIYTNRMIIALFKTMKSCQKSGVPAFYTRVKELASNPKYKGYIGTLVSENGKAPDLPVEAAQTSGAVSR